jgi:integrase
MATVAFLTGMRFSEYSALRWEDIQDEEELILLRRSQVGGHIAATKNTEPRVIPMDDEGILKDAFRRQRQWLLRLQKRRGPESGYVRGFSDGWVFPSRTGGLCYPSLLVKPFAKVAEEIHLGRTITSHDCRRTFNTLARQAQVPDRVIQVLVGHHSDEMTERYDRVEVRERRQAIGQVIRFAGLSTKVGG